MWLLLGMAVAQNCLHDYLLEREDSCYFGSDSSRIELLADIDAKISNCDFETCECSQPSMDVPYCNTFSMQAMLGYMTVNANSGAVSEGIFKNVSTYLYNICVENNQNNELQEEEVNYSFGACGPANLPDPGHNAGIVAYVSVVSGLATFVYLYSDKTLASPTQMYADAKRKKKRGNMI